MTGDQSEDRTNAGANQGPGDDPRARVIGSLNVVSDRKTDSGADSGSDHRSQQGAVPPFAWLLDLLLESRAAGSCQYQAGRSEGQET
jgi:hypothetical protein